MTEPQWHDLGAADDFRKRPLTQVTAGKTKLAVSWMDDTWGAVSGVCNHVGGPLGSGTLDGEYITCPWHYWKFHRQTGEGEPGFEDDKVPRYTIKEENGQLLVDLASKTKRGLKPHAKHALDREPVREDGPLRVAFISTTAMDPKNPRFSTSEFLLQKGMERAEERGAETRLIQLSSLAFRACEGFYSKAAEACTWPCSITQMDPKDQMDQVYEAIVFWADVIVIGTPIRWGGPSNLYFKMAERLNCVQNQITIRDRVMMRNKVASFIITGGQDNVQAVAGQAMMFFAELGCQFPQFPFIGHSRGWSAEDMERNIAYVQEHDELHHGARALVDRGLDFAAHLLEHTDAPKKTERRGRKASGLVETKAHP